VSHPHPEPSVASPRRLQDRAAWPGARSQRAIREIRPLLHGAALLPVLLGTGCAERREPDPFAATRVLPTRYSAGRFLVRPVTGSGDTLTFFTDTGGGLFVYADVGRRSGFEADSEGVRLPSFAPGQGIPEPLGSPDGRLFVMEEHRPDLGDWDGMLGQAWFAERVWTFDYPGERLLLWPDSTEAPVFDSGHAVPLGFRTDSTGTRVLSFPRIRVEIDGDSLDLLFDTGATARLPEAALETVADGLPAERATSFITSSVLNRWRERHPDWRVVEDADATISGMVMIEVPAIRIAGFEAGPVWFTERPDRNFHEYMSSFMDQRVEGALGGSGLKYFRITLDYPRAVAWFEQPGR
jgi:hypothetical protein